MGGTDPDMLSSLASRLARLDRQCGPEERHAASRRPRAGVGLADRSAAPSWRPSTPTRRRPGRAQRLGLPPETEPTEAQIRQAAEALAQGGRARRSPTKPGAAHAARRTSSEVRADHRRGLAGRAARRRRRRGQAKERARTLVAVVRAFLAENKDEIDALQFFYSQPYGRAAAATTTSRRWPRPSRPRRARGRPEKLWRAYEIARASDKVRGASAQAAAHRHRLPGPLRAAPATTNWCRTPSRCAQRFEQLDGAAGEPRPAVHRASRCAGWR